jgi:hypothetical protein
MDSIVPFYIPRTVFDGSLFVSAQSAGVTVTGCYCNRSRSVTVTGPGLLL